MDELNNSMEDKKRESADNNIRVERQWRSDGTVSELTTYKGDVKHGQHKIWWPNGCLFCSENYKEGKLDGPREVRHMSGLLAERCNYKYGKKEGLYEGYRDISGFLATRCTYKNDKIDGVYESWDSRGDLISRKLYKDGEFVKGLRAAEVRSMDERAQATLSRIKANDKHPERGEIEYLAGKPYGYYYERLSPDGVCERWYENGRLMSVQQVDEDGIPCGFSEEWNEWGELEKRCSYKKGMVLNGLYERWYGKDQIEIRANYKDGKRDGLLEKWHPNGQIVSRDNYKDDKLNGLSEEWNRDGELQCQENYKNGALDGLSERRMHVPGMICQHIYMNGVIIAYDSKDHFSKSFSQETRKIDLMVNEESGNEVLTSEDESVIDKIRSNDRHPERGEINLVKDDCGNVYFERRSRESPLDLQEDGDNKSLCSSDHMLYERWDKNGDLTRRVVVNHSGYPLYMYQARNFGLNFKRLISLDHYQPIKLNDTWLQLGMDGKARLFQTDPTYISDEVAELARELEPSLRRKLDQLGADPDNYIRIKRGSEIEEKSLSKGDSQEKRRSNELKI